MFLKIPFLGFIGIIFLHPAVFSDSPTMESQPMVRALYGFQSNSPWVKGLSPQAVAKKVSTLGAHAVFLKEEPPELIGALKKEGILCFREIALFVATSEEQWNKQPGSRPTLADGSLMEPEGWYYGLNPTLKSLQEKKLTAISKIAKEGLVDGIWLDFIRWPIRWEKPDPNFPLTDFSKTVIDQFSKDSEIQISVDLNTLEVSTLILEKHADAWYRWRADQITNFVQKTHHLIKKINPDLKIGLFSLPWHRGEHEDAIYRIAGQDVEALAQWVDIFSPMVYHQVLGKQPTWIHDFCLEMNKITQKPIWPIIQSWSDPKPLSNEEFLEAVKQGEKQPSEGVIVFSLKHLVKEQKLEDLANYW